MANSLDDEWLNFMNDTNISNDTLYDNDDEDVVHIPKSDELYISTQTKIAFLNREIDIYNIFWLLPIIEYYTPKIGIIKKSIKINCINNEEVIELENNIKDVKYLNMTIINQINERKGKKLRFKDIRKIDIGLCKKDIINHRKKTKGAFYNCFALIMRIKYENKFKEVHVKVFNTGKLEIPGIKDDTLLDLILDILIKLLRPIIDKNLCYNKDTIDTVLINSNFNCGYYIKRNELFKRLKNHYKLHTLYDPCSYPGIQCKFYHNEHNDKFDGICHCEKSCNFKKKKKVLYEKKCTELSFMIFRTGSVLIVGNCKKDILINVYKFLTKLFHDEYHLINKKNINIKDKKIKKTKDRKKVIYID